MPPSDPHNPARSGELWNLDRIKKQLETVLFLTAECRGVSLSGGIAWHFMSPKGHPEVKIFHDHKDIDLFVEPDEFSGLVRTLKDSGFQKVWTKYDNPSGQFVRYVEKFEGGKNVLDIYVQSVPHIDVETGDEAVEVVQVVEPSHLIGLYETTHSSKECTAVKAAKELLAQGISPVGRPELVGNRI